MVDVKAVTLCWIYLCAVIRMDVIFVMICCGQLSEKKTVDILLLVIMVCWSYV